MHLIEWHNIEGRKGIWLSTRDVSEAQGNRLIIEGDDGGADGMFEDRTLSARPAYRFKQATTRAIASGNRVRRIGHRSSRVRSPFSQEILRDRGGAPSAETAFCTRTLIVPAVAKEFVRSEWIHKVPGRNSLRTAVGS